MPAVNFQGTVQELEAVNPEWISEMRDLHRTMLLADAPHLTQEQINACWDRDFAQSQCSLCIGDAFEFTVL